MLDSEINSAAEIQRKELMAVPNYKGVLSKNIKIL
jgi:hypothetical protein